MRHMLFLLVFMLGSLPAPVRAAITVIGHESMKTAEKIDKSSAARIYTGRTVQIDGEAVQPVNLQAGNTDRQTFIQAILQQNDDEYIAYWLVRKSIGKGTPPPELGSPQDMIGYVRSHPGAIGYVNEKDLQPGVRVLITIP